jgi:hypothetical protein
MKFTIRQLLEMESGMVKLRDKDIPIVQAYRLKKFIGIVMDELKLFHEHRMEIMNKYAMKDEDGKFVVRDDGMVAYKDIDDLNKCNTEIGELVDIEVEINFDKIPINMLGDINISIQDLMTLEPILDDIS